MPDDVIPAALSGMVGTALVVAYLRDAVHVWLLWSRGIRTSGVVVDNQVNETDAGTRWTPIFAFEDQQGNRVSCKPIVRMDARMQPGQVVPVVYLARKPSVMLLFTRWNMIRALLENTMLLIVGSGFLGSAAAIVVS
ncbi:DUF3592 domain-containing protein [Actinomadura bangladeshensis]|uniref:DUF3592 domain-containing protein n=1 Tax=Actinomadura bangladeshensis TaxID=453573 RepID=A0A4R4P0E2_9ACTN|nr:DUF3592 domain-containing protein [Actinomadura bangladeshensis]TDC13322.1 DUF3592 domain-containing protein [Actinomadura bangladeshensis]